MEQTKTQNTQLARTGRKHTAVRIGIARTGNNTTATYEKENIVASVKQGCPQCQSTNVHMRSGYKVCFNCGEHF